jgi:hypothetical protein
MLRTKNLVIGGLMVGAIGVTAVALFASSGPRIGRADLSGYQEIPTLSTPAHGTLDVAIAQDGASLDYKLSYEGFETNVLQAHIHLGRPAFNGGIMLYLCTNLAAPAGVPQPPACPTLSGEVSGTLTAADVFGPAGQGITANEFAEAVAALRAEATYGNVHTTRFPGGEIRAQVIFHANGAAIR